MRSSRNLGTQNHGEDACCNRLENAVKPQLLNSTIGSKQSCNRLENAVKPQLSLLAARLIFRCNRLENAVKPQHDILLIYRNRCCNRLENAVKPQQTTSEIRTWPHVSAYKMRSGCKHGQESQYCSLNTTD